MEDAPTRPRNRSYFRIQALGLLLAAVLSAVFYLIDSDIDLAPFGIWALLLLSDLVPPAVRRLKARLAEDNTPE